MKVLWFLEGVNKSVGGDRHGSLWGLERKIAGVGGATYADINTPAAVMCLAAPPQRSPDDRHHDHADFPRVLG